LIFWRGLDGKFGFVCFLYIWREHRLSRSKAHWDTENPAI
jgi:hypothetical protein